MVERGYLSAPLPVTALGASDGNRTHARCLASNCTSRYTTPAWYLRSHLGSSEIKPHPMWECVFMSANGTNYGEWCAMTGSNRRPLACKANALPAELIAHMLVSFLNHIHTLGKLIPLNISLIGVCVSSCGLHQRRGIIPIKTLMELLTGFEPVTSSLPRKCSTY